MQIYWLIILFVGIKFELEAPSIKAYPVRYPFLLCHSFEHGNHVEFVNSNYFWYLGNEISGLFSLQSVYLKWGIIIHSCIGSLCCNLSLYFFFLRNKISRFLVFVKYGIIKSKPFWSMFGSCIRKMFLRVNNKTSISTMLSSNRYVLPRVLLVYFSDLGLFYLIDPSCPDNWSIHP